MSVPWLLMVGENVGTIVIALPNVDATIIKVKILPCRMNSCTTAMPGDVGDLALVTAAIKCVGRIAIVLRFLISVIESSFKQA